jgi:hypothetical protein
VPAAPPALPGTGRVGAGSLLYAACHDGCQPLLLTQDGAQFQLEKTTPGPPTRAQTLSPDGRWMGQIERGRYVVRELAGVRRHELPGSWDAWAWSPEGRWLLLADHQDGDVRSYLRMDVASGRSTPLPPPAGSGPAYAVLGSGELLFGPPERFDDDGLTTAPITYQVFDPVRRAVVRSVRVDVRAALRGGEVVAAHAVRVAADGASLVVEVLEHRVDSVSRPTAVVTVSADGRVGRRLALPASGDGYALPGGVWSVERPVRDGLLLLHTSSTVTEVVLLDLRTGSMRPLFVLPANVPVTVPGRARY